MRVIITIECKGDEPETELSRVLNEVAEKISGEGLTVGEYLLREDNGDVTGKMFIEDTEGFLTDEGFKKVANTIKGQRRNEITH
ncbi:MAG: hypothetical protein UZ01_03297 [Candidatus Brocadia sinica]|nr:MAG: hypothetical protein UZ01_03297 [Candidatus Brocadia sinica]